MVETLGTIAALIAIGSFVWAGVKRFRHKDLMRAKAAADANDLFEYYFDNWRKASLSTKHLHILSYENFQRVIFHKGSRSEYSEEQRLYMFVCSLVHSYWGDWLPEDIAIDKVIPSAATLLDGRRGWRPVWRAAYTIGRLSRKLEEEWFQTLPEESRHVENFAAVAEVLSGVGVVAYLIRVARGDNSHLRDKAYAILQEIDSFSPGEVPPEFNKSRVPPE